MDRRDRLRVNRTLGLLLGRLRTAAFDVAR
jgi:hypothetical protein